MNGAELLDLTKMDVMGGLMMDPGAEGVRRLFGVDLVEIARAILTSTAATTDAAGCVVLTGGFYDEAGTLPARITYLKGIVYDLDIP